MNLTRATREDLIDLSVMFDQYRQFYGQTADLASAVIFLTERLKNDESMVFIARGNDGSPLGFTQLYPSFSSVRLRRTWILNDLFVVETARRRGVAEALLKRAAEFARETGARGLMLQTAADNIPAQYLYEKLGWKKDTKFFNFILVID